MGCTFQLLKFQLFTNLARRWKEHMRECKQTILNGVCYHLNGEPGHVTWLRYTRYLCDFRFDARISDTSDISDLISFSFISLFTLSLPGRKGVEPSPSSLFSYIFLAYSQGREFFFYHQLLAINDVLDKIVSKFLYFVWLGWSFIQQNL